jgi:hypothetical protein
MRATLLAGLALLAVDPALAQSRGSLDSLNETNERLSNRSETRSIEQRQQFENNQTRMDLQRNELLGPTPSPGVIVVPGRR